MIPGFVAQRLEDTFEDKITHFSYQGGGSINYSGKIILEKGSSYFVKWNSASSYPMMFEKEALGLRLLQEQSYIKIPEVIATDVVEDVAFLVLEYVERGYSTSRYWERLGLGLGKMHQLSQDTYGLHFDNYIGSLAQSNNPTNTWSDFFISQRIQPLAQLAYERGEMDLELLRTIENSYKVFEELCISSEPPSLLHGDLWSGNVFSNIDETPVLFDPATYFGNREIELAFTRLFGGFTEEFYAAYESIYPLAPEHQERVDMYQLYPLLVHLILFGSGYLGAIKSALKRYL